MSRSVNVVVLSGRLTGDPVAKKVGDFDVTNFRLASNRVVGKQKVEKTLFIDVDTWGALARVCAEHLTKGSRIAVEGVLCQDTWEGKEGQRNSKIFIEAENVTFLDSKGDVDSSAKTEKEAPVAAPRAAPAPATPARASAPKKPAAQVPPPDDDIPF